MKNILDVDGHKAVISFDPELGLIRGEFLGLNGGADFYAQSVEGLLLEGRKSLQVFLEMCAEKGIAPFREFSGRFNVRLTADVHEAAVLAAAAENKSLNEWIAGAIEAATRAA
ncbi:MULTISPECIES: type II toxin-antitoxin system HicB family antitoxin [unclassified Phyllobacterium]|uniref:type II toxin-antitoxin system HicB family antitoxin n=1 Tax=Phyllobacterium TaxID=28100 RepID=UPI000DD58E3B|nr:MULTISPECIES: type II toxin-antitoxin system HicB family antitoxin [unclassified Phyllobacterium]MBA8900777.1 putative HicB family RNase H-like nuclease [Phyllobacterium sp. P30BS-XVII]UGX86702.1 type II toxin-antitoxin system HicB family antitoxin [Phyllobacterium sp. T1293]